MAGVLESPDALAPRNFGHSEAGPCKIEDEYINEILGIKELAITVVDRMPDVRGAGELRNMLEIYLQFNLKPNDDPFAVAVDRLKKCNKLCTICDTPAPEGMFQLRPWFCQDHAEMKKKGIGIDISNELHNNSQTVAFLATLYEACHPEKEGIICYSPSNPPTIQLPITGIVKNLLRMIVGNCQTYMVYAGKDKSPDGHEADVFVVKEFDSEKKRKFDEAAKQGGQDIGYHGSNFKNWHNILAEGLMNFSGTSKMAHGAAYGNGIYLAKKFSTSYGYANSGHQTRIIAECLIAKPKDYYNPSAFGGIWVVPNSDHVMYNKIWVIRS